MRLAHIIRNEGFVDKIKEHISALIDCHSDPLTEENLLEMTKSPSEEENEEEDEEETKSWP